MLFILSAAYNGSRDQLISYNIDAESKLADMRDFLMKFEKLNLLHDVFRNLDLSFRSLYDAWSQSYKEEQTICSGSGDDKKCVTVLIGQIHQN